MFDYIDVHHHMFPPVYLDEWRHEVELFMGGHHRAMDWKAEDSLTALEADNAAAILSLPCPGIWLGTGAQARRCARACNEYAATTVLTARGRLGFFAVLPWLDVDATLDEIRYAFDTLHADGVGFITTYEGCYPGEPRFMPIWEELERRRAIVYFHPTVRNCCMRIVKGISIGTLEFPFDTARAVASLLAGAVFSRCPNVTFIFSNGGGALPVLADRLLGDPAIAHNAELMAAMQEDPGAVLRRLRFDTAGVTTPAPWSALTTFTSTSNLLFGSDFPFRQIGLARDRLQSLLLDSTTEAAILRTNAQQLFSRFRSTPTADQGTYGPA